MPVPIEAEFAWHNAVKLIEPFVVRIRTPRGSGTGFLVSHSSVAPMCGIATAAHVIEDAHAWEEPIRIEHYASGQSILLRPGDRAVIVESAKDTAAIVFNKGPLPLPSVPPGLIPEGLVAATGVEVAWLGFPAVAPDKLCFFHGRISADVQDQFAYLVDGVAINGVSGGPTLVLLANTAIVIGVLSAYIPNRATGEVLPGLAMVRDVSQFHETIKKFKSVDEAQKKQTPPAESAASTPEGSSNS